MDGHDSRPFWVEEGTDEQEKKRLPTSGKVVISIFLVGLILGLAHFMPCLSAWSMAGIQQKYLTKAIYSADRERCVWIDSKAGKKYVDDIIERFLAFDGSVTVGDVTDNYPRFFSSSSPSFDLRWSEMRLGDSILVPKNSAAMLAIMMAWEDGAKRVRKALKDQVPTYGEQNAN